VPIYEELLHHAGALATVLATTLLQPVPDPLAPPVAAIEVNREWEVLSGGGDHRALLREAGEELGDWTITLAGSRFDGRALVELAGTPAEEPLVRATRERLRRPIDVEDLLYFLDDLLAADDGSLRGKRVWIMPARSRNAGITLHVDDVFRRKRPRRYPSKYEQLFIDKPRQPEGLLPAEDGDILGPPWWARYRNPDEEGPALAALAEVNRSFAERIRSLLSQLRAQGADVVLASTLRFRERGYLMWGAFILSRCDNERKVERTVATLERLNGDWGLDIPIGWMHPDGWAATVEAARRMAETYDVVYATRAGAQKSDHYDGLAVDFTAMNLPRQLTLQAPNGRERTFDLSAPEQSRDLSLTPELIRWIEKSFHFEKLRSDYPHWSDAAAGH
jgi:hypothetical protein